MKDTKSIGCPLVVQTSIHPQSKDKYDVHCRKIPAEDSIYCPKHKLIVADNELEGQRKIAAKKARKEAKKRDMEFLKTSPLAAVNPKFDKKDKTYAQ